MTIITTEVTYPAAWASALVNGDFSGLDEAEAARVRAAIKAHANEGWSIVDVKRDDDGEGIEPRFTWSYDLYDTGADCTGGDVLDYVMHKQERDRSIDTCDLSYAARTR